MEPEVNYIASQVNSKNQIPSTVIFWYLSWQDILEQLITILYSGKMTTSEKMIIQDMVHLLERKGFKRFKDFCNLNFIPIIEKRILFCDGEKWSFFIN
ncbi:hypothetical protein COF80_27015 [Bacillus toyonensis]|nr:hypothetical protein COF80_27015 [Bacillus toyonensis]